MPRTSQASRALQESEEQNIAEEEYEESELEPSEPLFDIDNYRISSSTETKTLSIDGSSFDVQVKQISWSMRNQILSKCLKWDSAGGTVFDGDAYVRECLKEIIVEAPWGRTTESFLISIDHRLGGLLETLVPKAFDEEEGVDVEKIKKGP